MLFTAAEAFFYIFFFLPPLQSVTNLCGMDAVVGTIRRESQPVRKKKKT